MAATRVIDHALDVIRAMRLEERGIVVKLSDAYIAELRRLFSQPGSGRIYRRLRAGGLKRKLRGLPLREKDYITHQASAPGEPPARDRSLLYNSVLSIVELTETGWSSTIGSSIPGIPRYLELGTVKMAPRPAWRPAYLYLLVHAKTILAAGGAPGA